LEALKEGKMAKPIRIDSHQHFFKPDQVYYSWMKPEWPIARDFLPEDLKPLLERHGITKTVLVQAADSEEENAFTLDLAHRNGFIAGVVIWLDMESPQFPERLSHYMADPKFLGIRPMIESIPDDGWMLRPAVKRSFRLLVEKKVCFDFLTFPRHLPHVLQILEECPGLRAVIDHISKPAIKDGILKPWADLMAQVAAYPNVCCKLSGMITEAHHQAWKPADLSPYIRHVLTVFGPDRCMFGSDWPVCLLAGSYDQVVDALQRNLPALGDDEMGDIFGGTAARFYGLAP
jgi:L-fuconolactonase